MKTRPIRVFFVSGAARQLFGTMDFEVRKILCSYWYYKTPNVIEMIADIRKRFKDDPEYEFFTDSGAFSAHTGGVKISVDAYCKYIKAIKPTQYAALDVIGDPVASEKNTEIMEKEHGLKPIPCYHLCEDYKFLHAMIKKYDYIAFGGMVGAQREKLLSWLDEAWHIVMRDKPKLKVHGFGQTSLDILERYPWYSVDSSSITSAVRYGDVNVIQENGVVTKQRTVSFVSDYAAKNNDQEVYRPGDQTHKQVIALVQMARVFTKQMEALELRRANIDYETLGASAHLPGFEL